MQDRYAGDVGDYVKLALLRHLSRDRRLGVAWYHHPDEAHNGDGRHISYLSHPETWRHLDPELFDGLLNVTAAGRTVASLETLCDPSTIWFRESCYCPSPSWRDRSAWRLAWFQRACEALKGCDFVFADPDNGIVDDNPRRRSKKVFAKQIPLSEAILLSAGRPTVIYHHNSRFKGGHEAENSHWLKQLGPGTLAIRSSRWSCRTFFIVNPDTETEVRAREFCAKWAGHRVSLQER